MTGDSRTDRETIKQRHRDIAAELLPQEPLQLFVGGEWTDGESSETFETVDPTTGEPLATVQEGTKADIDRAVAEAWRAFETTWKDASPAARQDLLQSMADRLEARTDEFARLEVLDNGKPIDEARGDIALAVEHLRYFAAGARHLGGETVPHGELQIRTVREPYGVVGQIVPWNFPLLLAVWKLAPALAAGNAVVLKPAEQTPVSILRFMQEVEDIVPDGVINVVPGFGSETGAPLVSHPDVPKIAFTGSTEVGQGVMKAAAETVTDLTLELGGKSPLVIGPEADLSKSVDVAAEAVFFNGGECCSAATRLLVHEERKDEFVLAFLDRVGEIRVGDPLDETTDLGPQISRTEVEKTLYYIKLARESGADILAGGGTISEDAFANGYFVAPTVLDGLDPDHRTVQEEIFGPVEVILPWSSYDEMIATANDVKYGLAAGVVTENLSFAREIADDLEAGTVWINTFNRLPPGQPFGGYRQSGVGREGALQTLSEYTRTKSITTATDD